MTKKNYSAIAATLREARGEVNQGNHCDDILNNLEVAWSKLFAKDNLAFNITKFMEAAR